MIFNSVEFIIFLFITYWAYRVLPFRSQNGMLLVSSYIFYGWWNPRMLFLILLTTALDFCCALMIRKGQLTPIQRLYPSLSLILASFFFLALRWDNGISLDSTGSLICAGTIALITLLNGLYPTFTALSTPQRQKGFLWVSIAINLGILGVFKYFNFFVDSAEAILQAAGLNASLWNLDILLPVGISFYTFQTMSYTLDVYRKQMEPGEHFFDFALFVSFFPQLVAGPIVRACDLLPQISQPRNLSLETSVRGVYLILLGLFKKVAIADGLAGSVNSVYNSTGIVSWLDVAIATLLFTFQIYCDFAGYSDIARGVAKLFGIDLMTNFNLPYFSKNPSEFWQRWHISLSSWLRDYLYIPLGGNRVGKSRAYANLMTTMVLGGLWHGAAWNYVLWGFYQGILLCLYRVFGINSSKNAAANPVKTIAATTLFFGLTCYGWLLFRANSWEQIATYTKILFTDIGSFSLSMSKPTLPALIGLPLLLLYEAIEYYVGTVHFYGKFPSFLRGLFYAVLTLLIIMGTSNASAQFIYFQF
jgi:D-alanyl-lipoteichoic acid acyltransferase DltB (MBOAT superfamily)